jgi:Asp-tRNA(Asn)/Glu-tRNA(Gln) amidotransferase A subunit family amidase
VGGAPLRDRPEVDATVVTRILDAGGTIVGKTVCEYFCLSGGSHTSAPAPVHNPHRMGHSAGGSSSGSGAVVAAGEVPMALGGDQGGSIRMPSAHCGIYGMKTTHGLAPYTGIMPIELTLDHTGPMTSTFEDSALLLEVLAGPDGLDPRQYSTAPVLAAEADAGPLAVAGAGADGPGEGAGGVLRGRRGDPQHQADRAAVPHLQPALPGRPEAAQPPVLDLPLQAASPSARPPWRPPELGSKGGPNPARRRDTTGDAG